MRSVCSSRRLRYASVLALAYALALQALLGAMASGVFAGEVRRAAELGVICTIHGAVDGADREGGPADPTPGKLACIEHCLTGGQALAVPPVTTRAVAHAPLATPLPWPAAHEPNAPARLSLPPPARGPPARS